MGQLHGLLAGQLVAGVVQGEQQHAVALVGQLHGVEHQLSVGGGEDVAHRLDVQHALAHKASKQFVSKFGRAKSYGEKTIGTPDAGAMSMSYFFQGLAQA